MALLLFQPKWFLDFIFYNSAHSFFFLQISVTADKYLALAMTTLSHRFKLSPSVAAVTIISFAYGAPEIITSFFNSKNLNGSLISVGTLLGAFAFSTSLVLSNVRLNSETDVHFQKKHILKKLLVYFMAIAIIVIFGIFGEISYFFVLIFFAFMFIIFF